MLAQASIHRAAGADQGATGPRPAMDAGLRQHDLFL